jgi:hypothetical protein
MVVMQIAAAIVGAVSLYLGYRLFCESPVRAVSGALLALFGVAILSADFATARNHAVVEIRPGTHHAKPARVNRHRSSTEWFV